MPVNTASCRTPASQDSRGSAQVCGSGTKKHCTRSQPIIVIQTSLQSSPPGTAKHPTRTRTQPRKSRGAGAYIPRVDRGTHTPCRRDGKVRGQRRQLPDQTQPIHRGRSGIGSPTHPGPRLVLLSPSPRPNHAERADARAEGMGSRHRRRTGRVDCR